MGRETRPAVLVGREVSASTGIIVTFDIYAVNRPPKGRNKFEFQQKRLWPFAELGPTLNGRSELKFQQLLLESIS